ncbi:uncharacterized protein LOC133393355 [Anopheles gambiae]|uniref:uncharacterized protein LOC133393355 n=1 Tax=Anopheles gambiae TaxID=7165 RepID=UPI002AC9205B|nr:uncharacterized protein LOC133393355 [Anopheles gambiae]XP_061514006.1 uncharacterized protein LOC133393355 [Anopheles gambiae]XP_061514007.1 uncharacterized protein LOC133393355 [Anopheles gambiae]XP_061514008.1 uncharacterized protein LOC133393355 [Anopheles gambiae]
MPFSIITTHGPKGFSELTLVPDGWIQSTSAGKSYVYWPKGDIAKLIKVETSTPSSGWTRQACVIQKSNILSLQQGIAILSDMSGESSDDSCIIQSVKTMYRQRFGQRALENANKVNALSENCIQLETGTLATGCSQFKTDTLAKGGSQLERDILPYGCAQLDTNTSPKGCSQLETDTTNEFMESAQPSVAPETTRKDFPSVPSQLEQNNSFSPTNHMENAITSLIAVVGGLIQQISDINSNKLIGLDKIDNLTKVLEQQIVPTLGGLVEEFKELKKKVNLNTVQMDLFINSLEQENRKRKKPSFSMDPIDNHKDLKDFDKSLEENDFKTSVIDWLTHNICETNSNNRMLDALDMLLNRSFCTQISWSGQGKENSKIPIKMFPNFLEVFREIGTTHLTLVTDQCLKDFFIKKLKHSQERCMIQGLRKPTSHNKRC